MPSGHTGAALPRKWMQGRCFYAILEKTPFSASLEVPMRPSQLVMYFVFILVSVIIKGLVGFGDPLLYTPLLSLSLPNSVITPGMAPMGLVLNARLVWKNRAHFAPKLVLPIAAFVLLGIVPGTLLLKYGSPQGLKLLLGLLIIGLGIEMLTRKHSGPCKPNRYVRAVVSFFSGFMAGLFGINMLFLAYLERVSANRAEFRANTCFVFFLDNIFRMTLMIAGGLYTRDALYLTLVALPASAAGMKLGALLDRRIGDRVARDLIVYVFLLGGVSTTVYALLSLL